MAAITDTPEGDAILVDMMLTLDQFMNPHNPELALVRQPLQKTMHEAMLIATLDSIYESSFDARHQREIMERFFSGAPHEPELLIVAPRRVGKTWSVAIFIAACLLCIPGVDIAVFEKEEEGSVNYSAVITLTRQLLSAHPRGGAMLARVTVKKMIMHPPADESDTRTVTSFSSTSKSVRCLPHHQLIFVDEITDIMESFFFGVILPIAAKKNTTFIGTGTARGEDNLFTYLCNLPDASRDVVDPVTRKVLQPGRIFRVLQITNTCDRCIAIGAELTCRHRPTSLPWKSTTRRTAARSSTTTTSLSGGPSCSV
jgi:hypothetical protein